jgi:hypothetical protein
MTKKGKKIFLIDSEGIKGFYEDLKEFATETERKEMKKNRKRVSYIYPANPVKRFFFKLIRKLVDDESPVADWTRKWKGKWIVVIDGKEVAKFDSRAEAIAFEKEFLWKKIDKGELNL